jgi:hypothetical protein
VLYIFIAPTHSYTQSQDDPRPSLTRRHAEPSRERGGGRVAGGGDEELEQRQRQRGQPEGLCVPRFPVQQLPLLSEFPCTSECCCRTCYYRSVLQQLSTGAVAGITAEARSASRTALATQSSILAELRGLQNMFSSESTKVTSRRGADEDTAEFKACDLTFLHYVKSRFFSDGAYEDWDRSRGSPVLLMLKIFLDSFETTFARLLTLYRQVARIILSCEGQAPSGEPVSGRAGGGRGGAGVGDNPTTFTGYEVRPEEHLLRRQRAQDDNDQSWPSSPPPDEDCAPDVRPEHPHTRNPFGSLDPDESEGSPDDTEDVSEGEESQPRPAGSTFATFASGGSVQAESDEQPSGCEWDPAYAWGGEPESLSATQESEPSQMSESEQDLEESSDNSSQSEQSMASFLSTRRQRPFASRGRGRGRGWRQTRFWTRTKR